MPCHLTRLMARQMMDPSLGSRAGTPFGSYAPFFRARFPAYLRSRAGGFRGEYPDAASGLRCQVRSRNNHQGARRIVIPLRARRRRSASCCPFCVTSPNLPCFYISNPPTKTATCHTLVRLLFAQAEHFLPPPPRRSSEGGWLEGSKTATGIPLRFRVYEDPTASPGATAAGEVGGLQPAPAGEPLS